VIFSYLDLDRSMAELERSRYCHDQFAFSRLATPYTRIPAVHKVNRTAGFNATAVRAKNGGIVGQGRHCLGGQGELHVAFATS
jgi:hypothetical protein